MAGGLGSFLLYAAALTTPAPPTPGGGTGGLGSWLLYRNNDAVAASSSAAVFGADSKSPAISAPRAQEPSQPVGPLRPFVSASTGWFPADNKPPVVPAPRAQDAAQPTGPLSPSVSLSSGWDTAPGTPQRAAFPARAEPSAPVGAIIQALASLGWGVGFGQSRTAGVRSPNVDTSAPIGTLISTLSSSGWFSPFEAPRAALGTSRVQPTDPLRGLQFGGTPWSGIDIQSTRAGSVRVPDAYQPSAPLVPFVSASVAWQDGAPSGRTLVARSVESTQPVGALIAASLPSTGWFSTQLPARGTLAASRSQEQSAPVAPLLPFVSLSVGWQASDVTRTTFGTHVVDASAPVGSLISSGLTSLGWLSVNSPAGSLSAKRAQDAQSPSGPLRPFVSLALGWLNPASGSPVVPAPRSQDAAQPPGPLASFVSLSSGWQATEQARTRAAAASPAHPVQAHIHTALAFGGAPWAIVDTAQQIARGATGQETAAPVGLAFSQALTSLGWMQADSVPSRLIPRRAASIEAVGDRLSQVFLPSMGWQSHVDLPPRWCFVARPIPSAPVGSSFALTFIVAPFDRCSPVFDVSGAGRLSAVFDVTGHGRMSPVFDVAGTHRLSPAFDVAGTHRLSAVFDVAGHGRMSPVFEIKDDEPVSEF